MVQTARSLEPSSQSEEHLNVAPRRRMLAVSFGLTLAVLGGILATIAVSSFDTASASTYTYTSGITNWTGGGWTCVAGAPGSTVCGPYPGEPGGAPGDVATVSIPGLSLNSTVALPVTLNLGGSMTVGAAGQLTLTGASSVTGGTFTVSGTLANSPASALTLVSGGSPVLALQGGLINNQGTITVQSAPSVGAGVFNWTGGTLQGSGSTVIQNFVAGANGTFNMTGTSGPMTLDTQTVNNNGNTNFSGPNPLIFANGAVINNNGTGSFIVSTNSPINQGAGTLGKIGNSGTFSKTGPAGTLQVNVDLDNTAGTVAVNTTFGDTISLNAGGQQSGGAFALNSNGGGFIFGGAHTFSGSTFSGGSGSVQIASGGVWNVASSVTTTVPLTNAGSINFPAAPAAARNVSVSAYSGAGSFAPRLIANGVNDLLNVTTSATLTGGTLSPTILSPYVPAGGDVYNVVNYGTVAGTFNYTPVTYPGGTIQVSYPSPNVRLAAVVSPPDLAISKAGPASVTAGTNATYVITITNLDAVNSVTSIQVDDIPSGMTFVSATGACTAFPCTISTPLGPGASVTINATFAVPASATGTVSNTSNIVSSAPGPDPVPGNNTATANSTVTQSADLAITKTGPASALTGQNVTYTTAVTNNGPSDAANVSVADPTPAGLTFVSNSGACSTTFPCNLGTLVSGGTATITSVYTVNATATSPVTNTATVSATTGDPAPGNNSATASTAVTPSADLAIIKSGPGTFTAGQSNFYTISVTNNGPSAAANVTVTDPTPAGTTFVSNSGACTGPFPCNVGTLNAGQTVTITSTYQVPSNGSGTVTNTASVSATGSTDTVPGNNSSTTTPASVTSVTDYGVLKTGPATASTGSTITYTVEVKNFGPSDGTGTVTVSDPTPTGLTLLSVSGGGCTAYPCAVGPLTAGSFVTITNTYQVTATSGSVINQATIPLAGTDPNSANNASSVTTAISPNADLSITKTAPRTFSPTGSVTFTITVTNNGPGTALNVVVNDPTPAGLAFASNSGACSTPFPCNLGSMNSGTSLTINARYVADAGIVSATNRATVSSSTPDLNSTNNTATRTVVNACPSAPQIISPLAGTLTSPVTFTWTAAAGADSYTLFVGANGATPSAVGQPTTGTTLTTDIPNGSITWYVLATSAACPAGTPSNTGSFNICSPPAVPEAGVVGAPTSGQPYAVLWDPVPNASGYEIQEATNDAFTDAVTQSIGAQSVTFTHNTTAGALVFFYRVRALGTCSGTVSGYSRVVRVVVLPPPANQRYPNFDIPAGTQNRVQLEVFIEGDPSGPQNFTITLDKPWMISVDPSSGVLPTAGRKVTLTVDPSQLPNGTFTGTLLVELTPVSSNSRLESNATKPKPTPVTVNLVTPIIPTAATSPTADTIIIPAVGRLTGINSQWRSDVRVFNGSSQALKYQLDFVPSQASESKKTTLSTAPGDTTALDDIIHNWYGFGEVGDNASGVLQIRALTSSGSPSPSASLATVVSSRTYNNTPNQGTLGQFIPGIFFRNFVGRQTDASKAVAVLSLQQLAQTNSYRTNVGIVEGSGAPATVLLSIFNSAGQKLVQDFSLSLKAGEQVALNQLLAQKGITSNDARLEVRVTGGEGKVTAYASVVDNNSLDPLLVSPVILGQTTARTYVLPGVADLNTGSASWRSDLRILNGSSVPQAVDLLFYPQGNAGNPSVASLTVNPGEVKVLDNVLASLFSTTNAGGAVHVNTVNDSQLVVTGRTFNQTSNGTLGQFIPAATLQDAIDRTTRALNILQVEDSVRYRTNVGLAEMSGQSATVQVSVNLPDSKVTPTIQIPLAANEFRQFALRDLGLANIYNARVSISVISGNGKVTAYGSVIDMTTSDPTYVPAQ